MFETHDLVGILRIVSYVQFQSDGHKAGLSPAASILTFLEPAGSAATWSGSSIPLCCHSNVQISITRGVLRTSFFGPPTIDAFTIVVSRSSCPFPCQGTIINTSL